MKTAHLLKEDLFVGKLVKLTFKDGIVSKTTDRVQYVGKKNGKAYFQKPELDQRELEIPLEKIEAIKSA